jgi:hypothetical protein
MGRVTHLLAVAAVGSVGLAVPHAAMARTSTVKDCDERKATPMPNAPAAKLLKPEPRKKKRYILM